MRSTMPRITHRYRPELLAAMKAAAERERLTLHEWLERAAELAIARGSTR